MPFIGDHCQGISRYCISCVLAVCSAPAISSPLSASLIYKADAAGVVQGGNRRGIRYLDDVEVMSDLDLGDTISWHGALLHVHLLGNQGRKPNELAGTLQGVNNIEVADPRAKLFEAWFEQTFAQDKASLLIGLYDLNSEFYSNEASALLIAPAFGIGSELAATGPNGPSIFPSTALALRLRIGAGGFYGQAAVLDAQAGIIDHPDTISSLGKDGILAIGELGWSGEHGKLGVGSWRYSRAQPEIAPPGLSQGAALQTSQGAYLIAEHDILGSTDSVRHARIFGRAGISDGRTTPFRAGWQAGLHIDHLFAGRPASALSLGINRASLSTNYRRQSPPLDSPLAHAETGFEITYRDRILPHVLLQPDLQYVLNPAGSRTIGNALILGLRLQVQFDLAAGG